MVQTARVTRLSPGKDCGLGIADEKTKRMREGILGTRMRREGEEDGRRRSERSWSTFTVVPG